MPEINADFALSRQEGDYGGEQEKLSITLDLTCRGYRNEILPFQISLHADAVAQLIADALSGHRIYELFSVRRRGDIKRYLWVRLIDVAEWIKNRYEYLWEYTNWPENECPYPKWDDALFLTADEEPEECAWHHSKELPELKEFVDYWFDRIAQTQDLLRQSPDIFIGKEIRLIDEGRHDHEYDTAPPIILTQTGFARKKAEDQYPEWFYEDLTQILRQPDIHSVACRSTDFKTFRLLCMEQLNRCTYTPGSPEEVFSISVTDLTVEGTPDCRFPRASRWGGYARCSWEGLGYGDLFIDMDRRVVVPAKVLVEEYWWHDELPRYILTDEDLGRIKGYEQKVLRDGLLLLYKKLSR